MIIVVKEVKAIGGITRTIPENKVGVCKLYHSLNNACDHLVWLEQALPESNWSVSYKLYDLSETQLTCHSINSALKRAGIVEPERGPVKRAVYEDLLEQHKALEEKVTVLEADNRDLESSCQQYRSSLKQKALDLDAAYDKLERIGKLAEED